MGSTLRLLPLLFLVACDCSEGDSTRDASLPDASRADAFAETDAGLDSGPSDAGSFDGGDARDSGSGADARIDAPADAAGDAAPLGPRKIVFATSELVDGNLAGLAGADAICQRLADAAGLSGVFLAWLSDSVESPATRFARSSVAYTLVDGTVVATDWADLVDGTLANPIVLTEMGGRPPSGSNVVMCTATPILIPAITATLTNGNRAFVGNCADWTTVTPPNSVHIGDASDPGRRWTHTCAYSNGDFCARTGVLYCFEQ